MRSNIASRNWSHETSEDFSWSPVITRCSDPFISTAMCAPTTVDRPIGKRSFDKSAAEPHDGPSNRGIGDVAGGHAATITWDVGNNLDDTRDTWPTPSYMPRSSHAQTGRSQRLGVTQTPKDAAPGE